MMPPATRLIQRRAPVAEGTAQTEQVDWSDRRCDGETDDGSFQQMLHGGRWEEKARRADYVISPTVVNGSQEGLTVSGLEG
jgi:hypothetical protein